jgi:hypothetical protein
MVKEISVCRICKKEHLTSSDAIICCANKKNVKENVVHITLTFGFILIFLLFFLMILWVPYKNSVDYCGNTDSWSKYITSRSTQTVQYDDGACLTVTKEFSSDEGTHYVKHYTQAKVLE